MRDENLNIRAATESDRAAVWDIFHEVVAGGDTYVFDPQTSREEALEYWFRTDTRAYAAEQDRHLVGSYILKANQPALGSHVPNASFIVADNARGEGIGLCYFRVLCG